MKLWMHINVFGFESGVVCTYQNQCKWINTEEPEMLKNQQGGGG